MRRWRCRATAHKTLKAVQADYDKLAFNKAVARIYEFVNALCRPLAAVADGRADAEMNAALRNAVEILMAIIAPMMPHSGGGMLEGHWRPRPGRADRASRLTIEALVAENEITLPVQINGKKRGDLTIARDADQMAIESAVLAARIGSGTRSAAEHPRRSSSFPQRIVNVVV